MYKLGFPIFTAKNRYYIIIYCDVRIRPKGQKSVEWDMLNGAKSRSPMKKYSTALFKPEASIQIYDTFNLHQKLFQNFSESVQT